MLPALRTTVHYVHKQYMSYSPLFSSMKTTTLSRLMTQYYKITFQPHPSATERANASAR